MTSDNVYQAPEAEFNSNWYLCANPESNFLARR